MKTPRFKIKNGLLLAAIGLSLISSAAIAEPFRFGIMADTQWKSTDVANNPSTVSLGIIKQILPKFIEQNVKFVVQVGDLTDNGSTAGLDVWAAAAPTLYDHGIGFYPLRGNHEATTAAAALYYQGLFPQTRGLGSNTAGATGHQSPVTPTGLSGLTYSFDYDNARFILVDQFTRTDGTGSSANSAALDQVSWITQTLSAKPAENHAFVFSHKPLIAQNHVDVLMGANPAANPTYLNTLIGSMASNNVRYAIGGHDHMHHRSVLKSPDGLAQVQNIIASSDSYKFYIPAIPSNDAKYNTAGLRESPIAQELFTVGYYIATVDGPRVTIIHYASDNGCGGTLGAGKDCDLSVTPTLSFAKRETFGYSLNGKEFVIKPNASFTGISDTSPNGSGWLGTHLAILGGVNAAFSTLYDGRTTVQDVNTGWTSNFEANNEKLKSDVLTLWGMANLVGSEQADQYTLSLNYDATAGGSFALVTKDDAGNWVNTPARNFGGNAKFVVGPWKSGYALGTYGLDPATHTAWAVVNRGGDFAVAQTLDGDLNGDGVIDQNDIALISKNLNKPATVLPGADLDNDGKITVLDARKLALICSLPACAVAH